MKLDENAQDPNPLSWVVEQIRQQTTETAALLIGVALIFLGRRLFWLFVGGVGFIAGMVFAGEYFKGEEDWIVLAVALSIGLVGALLSIFLQKIAVRLAGLLAGAYVLFMLAVELGYQSDAWIAGIVGGVLGFFLVSVLFDWSLVVLSALTGSMLISQAIPYEPLVKVAVFVLLFSTGLAVQARHLTKWRSARRRKEAEG